MVLISVYLSAVLAVLSITDLMTWRLPNRLLSLLLPVIGTQLFLFLSSGELLPVLSRTAAFLLGFTICLTARLGGGDCKLAACCGFLLGCASLLYALLIACMASVLYALLRRLFDRIPLMEPIPLGPFISLGTVIMYNL